MSVQDASVDQLHALLEVMERLRDPHTGCPWDLKQDFSSIVPHTIEEVYELVDAIEARDFEQVGDELGDVLFQIVFYAQLGKERGLFDFMGVVERLTEKLVRRHPHVFESQSAGSSDDLAISESLVRENWEHIKQQERSEKRLNGVLDDVPQALPALIRAQKLHKRVARVGFDWPDSSGAWAKVDEEMRELTEAVTTGDSVAIEAEVGDVLIAVVNLARHLGVDAETAARRANSRFENRFRAMEQSASEQGVALDTEPLEKLEERWQEAKKRLAGDRLASSADGV
jgi:ATP diphosphatase